MISSDTATKQCCLARLVSLADDQSNNACDGHTLKAEDRARRPKACLSCSDATCTEGKGACTVGTAGAPVRTRSTNAATLGNDAWKLSGWRTKSVRGKKYNNNDATLTM